MDDSILEQSLDDALIPTAEGRERLPATAPVWHVRKTYTDHWYYYNISTHAKLWDPPMPNWTARTESSGHIYYANAETGKVQWEPPQCLAEPAAKRQKYPPLEPDDDQDSSQVAPH